MLALKYCPTCEDLAVNWSIIDNFNVGIFTISSCSINAFLSTGHAGQIEVAVLGFVSYPNATRTVCIIEAISAREASLFGIIMFGLGESFKAPLSRDLATGILAHSGTLLPSAYLLKISSALHLSISHVIPFAIDVKASTRVTGA